MNSPDTTYSAQITYFQARPLPVPPKPHLARTKLNSLRPGRHAVQQAADRLPGLGFTEIPLGDFYDVAAQDSGLFRRFEARPASCPLLFHLPNQSVQTPRISILLSATGHFILGIGLEYSLSEEDNSNPLSLFQALSLLSTEQSENSPQLGQWHLGGSFAKYASDDDTLITCGASIRRAFDLLGFAIHEALLDRFETLASVGNWSQDWHASEQRIQEMHKAGEVTAPYIATWGYHANIHRRENNDTNFHNPKEIIKTMLQTRGATEEDVTMPIDTQETHWVVGDFESIRILTENSDFDADNNEASRCLGFVEYLAYRRGVITLIQRDMLRCSVNLAAITQEQVIAWEWTLSTITDDYVLAGWNLGLLRRVRAVNENHFRTWNLEHREGFARRQLESLKLQLESAQSRLSTALSLIFGIIAYASLLPVVSFALAWSSGSSSVADAPLDRPLTFTVVNLALLALLLGLSYRLVRRARTLRFSIGKEGHEPESMHHRRTQAS